MIDRAERYKRREGGEAILRERRELAHGCEVKITATHLVLLFSPRRVRVQQQCYHRLRLTALLHCGDVQRQSPILSTSQAAAWSIGVHLASQSLFYSIAGEGSAMRKQQLRGGGGCAVACM